MSWSRAMPRPPFPEHLPPSRPGVSTRQGAPASAARSVGGMLVHEMVVAERRHMADLFASLTEEQLAQQSLCDAWTMHEVAAHLATYLRFGKLKIITCMVAGAGDFAPGNQKLAR